MTVVFWFLVVLAGVAIWFLAHGFFADIGRMFLHFFDNAKDGLNEKEYNEEENDLEDDFENKKIKK